MCSLIFHYLCLFWSGFSTLSLGPGILHSASFVLLLRLSLVLVRLLSFAIPSTSAFLFNVFISLLNSILKSYIVSIISINLIYLGWGDWSGVCCFKFIIS